MKTTVALTSAFMAFVISLAPMITSAAQSDEQEGVRIYSAGPLVVRTIQAYYKMGGTWPANWAEIKRLRLFQADLITPDGQVVDPDDGNLDYNGDAVYVPPIRNELPRVIYVTNLGSGGRDITNYEIQAPATYHDRMLSIANSSVVQDHESWRNGAERVDLFRAFALASIMDLSIDLFKMCHGRVPNNLQELMSSGLSPIDSNSVNPTTGDPSIGTRDSYEVLYQRYHDDGCSLTVLDMNGNPVPWVFNY